MACIVYAGCGDLATASAATMVKEGHHCVGLRRSPEQLPDFIERVKIDLLDEKSLLKIPKNTDYLVITLTPKAFTEAAYQEIYIEGLGHLLNAVINLALPIKRIFFASSTSVYHQRQSEWVDESSETAPTSFSGQTMLAAEQLIAQTGLPSTVIRYSGIYGPGRERMINWANAGADAPQEPLHYSNRIHQEDCVAVINHFIRMDLDGLALANCYLASDNQPSTFSEVLGWLRAQLGVGVNPEAEQTKRIRTGSKRCDNSRLKATGYAFIHPDFRSGYRPMVKAFKAREKGLTE